MWQVRTERIAKRKKREKTVRSHLVAKACSLHQGSLLESIEMIDISSIVKQPLHSVNIIVRDCIDQLGARQTGIAWGYEG